MRPHLRYPLVVVLAVLFALPILGQAPLTSITELLQQGIDSPTLFASKPVRDELKLTDEQGKKIYRIVREAYDKNRRQIGKAKQEARENLDKALPDILRAEQVKRLEQIKLQLSGIIPFAQPEVQQKLKLTDKQKEEMQTIADDVKKDIRKAIESAGNLREKVQSVLKFPQIRAEAVQRAVDKLSNQQKKTWGEMVGDKFEFPFDIIRPTMTEP